MIKRILTLITAGAVVCTMAMAQQSSTQSTGQKELHKEITLEKDFVPEVKKATKKNTLPKVKKIATPARTAVDFSDKVTPVEVPTSIPTMMPYGYRTAHNFSDKRGYLNVGGGMAANFVGSAGYRIIDSDVTTLGAWLQHCSTWAGKNSTKWISDDALRLKQQFNDNKLGVDLNNRMKNGTLTAGAVLHFDSFNYYGATDEVWSDNNKQTFIEAGVRGAWDALLNVNDHELYYNAGLTYNHAGYDKPIVEGAKAARENVLNLSLGADYKLNDNTIVGLALAGDYVNTRLWGNRNYFLLTASPYLKWENHAVSAQLGADLLIGKPQLRDFSGKQADGIDNKKFHVSPAVKLDFNLADGAAFYINITGGKTINTLSSLASLNRYSDPTGGYLNTFSPFDGEAGFKIGPFSGFSMSVYGGYGMYIGDINGVVSTAYVAGIEGGNEMVYASPVTMYQSLKARGMKIGGELNYKYRSLIDARATITYAPAGDDVYLNGWTKSYPLDGLDGASLVSNIDVAVTPMRPLTIDLGMNIRTGRSQVYMPLSLEGDVTRWFDMDDVLNLHAGATWRFDKVVTLWLKGNNLLNRKWDVMPGMGAQKINVMAGVGLVF